MRGDRNRSGWGLGLYDGRTARVVRDAAPALKQGRLSGRFADQIEKAESAIILGHLRLATRGRVSQENNHPFHLHFLGHDWLFAHNGSAHRDDLVQPERRLLLEATVDTARVFEFIRHELVGWLEDQPTRSLVGGVRRAFRRLLQADPDGSYNLLLSNGDVTFALVHWRPFYLLRREKEPDGVLLLSTLQLTEGEPWQEIGLDRGPRLLIVSGDRLLLNDRLSTT